MSLCYVRNMRAATVVALGLVSGCSGGASAVLSGTYSCAEGMPDGDGGLATVSDCIELSGGTAQDLANNQRNCALALATFSFEPCPRTGAIGGCRQILPQATITTWFYDDGGATTASEVHMTCDQLASQFVSP